MFHHLVMSPIFLTLLPPQLGKDKLGTIFLEGSTPKASPERKRKGGKESPSIQQAVSNHHSDTDLAETIETIQIKY